MINVGLVTTTAPERCGLRTYAEELVRNAERDNPDIHFKLIGRPFDSSIIQRSEDCHIVHILHVNALYSEVTTRTIQTLKAQGKKTVCTLNDSTTENRSDFTVAFDRTCVHQPTSDGFQYVFHGIPTTELKPYDGSMDEFIGTSGFPIGFKNYPLAARLANAVGKKLLAILPSSEHADVGPVAREILQACPGSVVDTGFPDHEEVLQRLAQCSFTLYPYTHTGTGISGSARMGMATNRPVVISNVVRFCDILHDKKYSDEFYVIPSSDPKMETALPVLQQVITDLAEGKARVPKKTIEDMNWKVSAAKYVDIYRSLMEEVAK